MKKISNILSNLTGTKAKGLITYMFYVPEPRLQNLIVL